MCRAVYNLIGICVYFYTNYIYIMYTINMPTTKANCAVFRLCNWDDSRYGQDEGYGRLCSVTRSN